MLVRAEPEALARRGAVGRRRRHRAAGDEVALAVAALDRERQADAPRAPREQPVGEPEVAVGLAEHERDAAARRGEPDGPGDVAAAAEDRGGPQLVEHPRRPRARRAATSASARAAFSGLLRLRPSTSMRAQLVAGRRDELALGALAADEDDARAVSPQLGGDRQRRNHVPGCPARLRSRRSARASVPDRARSAAAGDGTQVHRPAARDVDQQPGADEQHHEVRRAVGDERQRHARQRREAEHDEDVEDRLAEDQARAAGRRRARRSGPWPAFAIRSPAQAIIA